MQQVATDIDAIWAQKTRRRQHGIPLAELPAALDEAMIRVGDAEADRLAQAKLPALQLSAQQLLDMARQVHAALPAPEPTPASSQPASISEAEFRTCVGLLMLAKAAQGQPDGPSQLDLLALLNADTSAGALLKHGGVLVFCLYLLVSLARYYKR